MKKNRQWKGFALGLITATLIFCFGTPALAATVRQLEAHYSGIKITLDGSELIPKDVNGNIVEPFTVGGTTYLPVRAIAGALGMGVSWDGATQTVKLTTDGTVTTQPTVPVETTPSQSGGSSGNYGTIKGKYFNISAVDAKWTDVLETSLYTVTPQKDGNKLLCLIFSAKNEASEIKNLGGFRAYADKKAALPTVAVGSIDDAIVFVGAVASGMETKAYSVWELPENCEEFQLYYYESDGSEDNQSIVIHLADLDK